MMQLLSEISQTIQPGRFVILVSPYLHDDRCFTLEDVVEYFNLVQELHLKAREKADLVAFQVAPGLRLRI